MPESNVPADDASQPLSHLVSPDLAFGKNDGWQDSLGMMWSDLVFHFHLATVLIVKNPENLEPVNFFPMSCYSI